jgi:hypothetical protein
VEPSNAIDECIAACDACSDCYAIKSTGSGSGKCWLWGSYFSTFDPIQYTAEMKTENGGWEFLLNERIGDPGCYFPAPTPPPTNEPSSTASSDDDSDDDDGSGAEEHKKPQCTYAEGYTPEVRTRPAFRPIVLVDEGGGPATNKTARVAPPSSARQATGRCPLMGMEKLEERAASPERKQYPPESMSTQQIDISGQL